VTDRTIAASTGVLLVLAAIAFPARAWDVQCLDPITEEKCPDPFANARTHWRPGEHSALLALSLSLSGLPSSVGDVLELEVHAAAADVTAGPRTYDSVRPVRIGSERVQTRSLSVSMMASLPDFSYTLWDWASGNEHCPPDPGNESALDCHNYETHIGWLNSNHMLPQAQRWYAYLHSLAVRRAAECARVANRLSGPQRARFLPWLLECEKEALVVEGVGHHYLQDAWASGHMMERWGSTEPADFGHDRALGFAIGAFVGAIHGAKAMLDDNPTTAALAPWDDPINAPNENVSYRDPLDPPGTTRPGVGDRFLPDLLDPSDRYAAQREALLGCAVAGLREVYAATARIHGPLGSASPGIDGRRSVHDASCWGQRVTNLAFFTGLGVHQGAHTGPQIVHASGPLAWAIAYTVATDPSGLGAPEMAPQVLEAFRRDVSRVAAHARVWSRFAPLGTDAAGAGQRGLAPLAGIGPNSTYARGGAGDPPSNYSDPPLPWTLTDPDPALETRRQALHLLFSDAHAADRCDSLAEEDLAEYVDAARAANGSEDPEREEAACGQCVAMIAPHLRFGRSGDHDARREAFCALTDADAPAFLYTGEDPNTFDGSEPVDLARLEAAAFERCGCGESRFTLIAEAPGASFSSLGLVQSPSIDQDGTVAFIGDPTLSPSSPPEIFSGRAFSDDVADYTQMTPLSGQPAVGSIQNVGAFFAGTVVFLDVLSQARLLTTDGESIRLEVTAATCSFDTSTGAGMTDDGAVVCERTLGSGNRQILLADDGTVMPVLEVSFPTLPGQLRLARLGPFNGNGEIAVVAGYQAPRSCLTELSLIRGTALVPIACVDDTGDGGESVREIHSVNSAGVIAHLRRESGDRRRVFLNQTPTTLVTPDLMRDVEEFALNDLGQVAFSGHRPGPSRFVQGIYTGTDLVADKVIEVGEPLFGATVTQLRFHRFGFNNAGQIAFRAGLSDGRQVIVRAEP